MNCGNCGALIDEGDRFCGDCGTPISVTAAMAIGGAGNSLEQSSFEFVCPKCNNHVSDDWRFCPRCQEPLVEVVGYSCSKCGKDVEDDWKVCPYCGESLDNVE